MNDDIQHAHLQKLELLSEIQQQFTVSWVAAEPEQMDTAGKLLTQFEQQLLDTINGLTLIKPSAEIKQELANKLSWLSSQITLVNNEKNRIAEQILQLSRAKKGYGSYDE